MTVQFWLQTTRPSGSTAWVLGKRRAMEKVASAPAMVGASLLMSKVTSPPARHGDGGSGMAPKASTVSGARPGTHLASSPAVVASPPATAGTALSPSSGKVPAARSRADSDHGSGHRLLR